MDFDNTGWKGDEAGLLFEVVLGYRWAKARVVKLVDATGFVGPLRRAGGSRPFAASTLFCLFVAGLETIQVPIEGLLGRKISGRLEPSPGDADLSVAKRRTAWCSGAEAGAIAVAMEQDTGSGDAARRSQEVLQRHVESGGETLERLQRSGLHAALDAAEVGARDAHGAGRRADGHAVVRARDAHGVFPFRTMRRRSSAGGQVSWRSSRTRWMAARSAASSSAARRRSYSSRRLGRLDG